jgi:hypothetical protein
MSEEGTIVEKQGEIVAVQPTKTGWTEIHLQETGKQYPYKASTKIEAIIEAANKALWQEAVLTAKEVDSGNPNPNRPGHNYINRTAMKVEVGGTVSAPASSSSAPASRNGGGTSTNDETRGSIERQTIVKAAIHLYPDGIVKSDAEFFGLLLRLEAFCAGQMHETQAAPGQADPDDLPF